MAITISEAIQRTVEHREIFADEMTSLWMDLMTGKLTPAQIAGLIVGLRVKKETIGEITAAAKVMRDLSTKVNVRDPESLLDIVGTGGDGARTFNISTTSMFVIAAAGGRVAKHGGGSVSSKSGAADALKAIGANIMLKPEQIAQCIEETHMGFMFAPLHHAAMKYAAPVRKELGIRTIFNILGRSRIQQTRAARCLAFSIRTLWASACACCGISAPSALWWCSAATAWMR